MLKLFSTFFLIFISTSCFVQCQYNNDVYRKNLTQNYGRIQHPVYSGIMRENWRFSTRTPPIQRPHYIWRPNQNFPQSHYSVNQQNQHLNPNHQIVQALNKIPAQWLSKYNRKPTTQHPYFYYKPSTTPHYYQKHIPIENKVVYWNKSPPKGRQIFLPIRTTTTTERYPSRIYYQPQKNNPKIFIQPKQQQQQHFYRTTTRKNPNSGEQDLAFATRKPKINLTTTRKWRTIQKNYDSVTKNYHYFYKTSKPRYVYPVYPSNQHVKYVPPKNNKGDALYFDRKTGIAMKNPPTRKVFYQQNSNDWKYQTRMPRIQKQWIQNSNQNPNYQIVKNPPLCYGCNHSQTTQKIQNQRVYFG